VGSAAQVRPLIRLDIDDARWIDFVDSCGDAQPFHRSEWAGLLSECYGYPSFSLALTDSFDQIIAGVPLLEVRRPFGPRRWVSLPFTDYCPPLATTEEAGAELVVALAAASKQAEVARVEVRSAVDGPDTHRSSDFVMHTLRLVDDPDTVFRTFKRTQTRQRIVKAERDGVTVRRSESRADLTEIFYRLHTRTRQRLGVPVQPRRFFELLHERIIEPGLGFLLLAYRDGTPIAGSVFLAWNRTLTYKYSASDTRFLRHRPNNLVLWTAIRWGCENGYGLVDFGRTDIGDDGLRVFKNGWGTDETPLQYTDIGPRPRKRSLESKGKALAPLLRRSPPWVTRLIGELFYRYTS
jgi:CelD/BcsL family acetyltransferase involved in cellulose biosynthesis